MQQLAWALFVFSLLTLGFSLWLRWTYRRRREPLPWHFAGNVPGGLGLVCLTGALILDHGPWVWVLLVATGACTAVDVVVSFRARKRALNALSSRGDG